MKANLLTSSKLAKRLAAFAHISTILPSPCGCVPNIVSCDCEEPSCFCGLELEFCEEHSAQWPDEYLVRIAQFLLKVDPLSYAEPPTPPRRIKTLKHHIRLAIYEERVEAGFALRRDDDRRAEDWKNGERTLSNRNGRGLQRLGSDSAPEKSCKSRWRGADARRVAPSSDSGVNLVEALVKQSEA